MSAPQPQLVERLHGSVEVRTPLRVARCPGCERDPRDLASIACDRSGCVMKHFSAPVHEGVN
jgi:hypothetical protein